MATKDLRKMLHALLGLMPSLGHVTVPLTATFTRKRDPKAYRGLNG